MKPIIFRFLCLLSVWLPLTVVAQDYNYRHYTERDGLVGPTVYSMAQDHDGFMWFGTETGVSRFDGTHFKNFTTKNGLPNNEIIRTFADSKGRVWLQPFKYELCYYKNGRLYTRKNDPLLRQIKVDELVTEIAETRDGLMIMDRTNVYCMNDTAVVNLTRNRYDMGGMVKMSVTRSGRLLIVHSCNMLEFKKGYFNYVDTLPVTPIGGTQMIIDDGLKIYLQTLNQLRVVSPVLGLDYVIDVPSCNTMERVNDSLICLNTSAGARIYNILTGKLVTTYLPDKNVYDFLRDQEGNIWLATSNEGVYRISSDRFLNLLSVTPDGKKVSLHALGLQGNVLHAGTDRGYFRLDKQQDGTFTVTGDELIRTPVKSITVEKDLVILSSGASLMISRGREAFKRLVSVSAIKQVAVAPDNMLVLASNNGIRLMAMDERWSQILGGSSYRGICVALKNDSIYYGSPNGLHLLPNLGRDGHTSEIEVSNKDSLLRSSIRAMEWDDKGLLWAATDDGVIAIDIQQQRAVKHITTENGLSSNFIRCLRIDGDMLWLGTDMGVNRVSISQGQVTVYARADGLASDIINSIAVEGDIVYAATQDGISYFDKHLGSSTSRCDLRLMNVAINGKAVHPDSMPVLSYRNSNLHLDYVGISYKSDGDIRYFYRLKGLDSSWTQSDQTSLDLISLPPGNYTLELYATNHFGVNSAVISLPLFVNGPFWQELWFVVLAALSLIGITWGAVQWRLQIVRKKEKAAIEMTRQLQELEQKALRAQMNPHFIFNCLTAVQEFIVDQDMESANGYLTRFARLIRQTLDISMQSSITVQDEVRYLRTYLELEQMRFLSRFVFAIKVDPAIDAEITRWPGMVLQPCVENAVYHGIRHLKDGEGQLTIDFRLEGQMIVCEVRDNGIGRKAAADRKGHGHVSWGARITQQRIDMMNKSVSSSIGITVTDLPEGSGTSVVVRFPLTTSIGH